MASGTPSTVIEPQVGRYMPSSSLTSVVLPEPFSPTSATRRAGGQREAESRSTGRRCPGRRSDRVADVDARRSRAGRGRPGRGDRGRVRGPPARAAGRRWPGWRSCPADPRRPWPAGCGSGGSARPPSARCRARSAADALTTTNAIAAIRPAAYSGPADGLDAEHLGAPRGRRAVDRPVSPAWQRLQGRGESVGAESPAAAPASWTARTQAGQAPVVGHRVCWPCA